MTQTKSTFCRICEPNCPVTAEVDDHGTVIELRPTPGHPTGGTACHKGLGYLDVHNDPDRANWPQRRTNDKSQPEGNFVRADWDSSLQDIGSRLRDIREQHGPNTIAVFHGNPSTFDSAGLICYDPFLDAVGTKMRFGGSTQDMANKTTGAAHVYGSTSSFMIPDLANTHYLLCIGANPRVSRWSMMSAPQDNLDVVKRIVERGGQVRFVNPRRVESSTTETGPTLLIKPGTDAYFLAALLHEIHLQGGIDENLVRTKGKHLDELMTFVKAYSPESVEDVTGISAAMTKQVAAEICAAPSAIVYMSTGVNQSRQGVLCYWLTEMINFVTGNLGREGGTFKPTGLIDACPPLTGMQVIETSVGPLELPDPVGYSQLPATLLADLIENGDIRALILWSGNPLITAGGEERLRAAFEKLDLFVSIDIYRSVTGEMCDYILPVTDWLERPDINLAGTGMQSKPHVVYTDAVVAPTHDRRDAWWILARIAQEMGISSPLDANPDAADATFLFDAVLSMRGLSVDAMRQSPSNTVMFPEKDKASLFEQCLQHPDHLIDCCPPAFTEAGLIARCADIFETLSNEPPDTLKMISLRTPYMNNSWLVNIPRYRRGRNRDNPLHMCEQDAASRGIFDGDAVRVSTQYGQIDARVLIDDDLRPGVVAMSHGYGTARATTQRTAMKKPGVNCNVLMPSGVGTYEPLSFMSWLSGVPVDVQPAAARAENRLT
ncbi:molybdopterin-dependent oxidoreductase [Rhodococcus sp. T2V]|uniref:molybdopterin-containing oxidoreductase family protein n=1 Tax=Rhodococcus sp. T2V TaxID=3034164 RepID=UPI0023E23E18|nr:molybdopterin-dependent oxidoreductase [Rhodococcus sp. T2V]MDF3311019.1 molybdopterin-dependent oxidoreductase [Rhodococcus sp. T2V]